MLKLRTYKSATNSTNMISQVIFQKLKKEYDTYETARRELIGVSNTALSKAKQAIFAVHRDDEKDAARLLAEVERTFKSLEPQFKKHDGLRWEGAYRAALEEYVEGKLFFEFLDTKRTVLWTPRGRSSVYVDADTYLAGLSDFTGELTRKAVQRATQDSAQEVKQLAEAVREVVEQLIKFDLTGYLRTKYDQAKQNLRRVEEVLYDIKMR